MLGYLTHALATPFASVWVKTSSQSWRLLPRPNDLPLVHAPGADSDRILLVGSGISVGYGVVSHNLALGGHLARELSAFTGHGASVGIAVSPEMNPQLARTILQRLDLGRFDAVVFTLGAFEALSLMPRGRWRHQVRDLLEFLIGAAPAALEIFFVATSMPVLKGFPRLLQRTVDRRTHVLNDQVRQLVQARPHTTFVEFVPKQGDIAALKGRETYHDWARLIAPTIAHTLEQEARVDRVHTHDEEQRLLALAALDINSVPTEQIEQTVATARRLFDAPGAWVSIVDGSTQHIKASDGIPPNPMPRNDGLCTITIRRAELFVVEDTTTDERVRDTAWATGEPFRFYAGYPLETPEGHRVGALCIVDTAPRAFRPQDAALLRDLALRVQALLWANVAR